MWKNITGSKKTFRIIGFLSFAVLIAAFFIFLFSVKADTTTLCSYQGPDLSKDLIRLTDFSVTGPTFPKEGDKIVVKFTLENFGQSDLNLGKKGVFSAARDPDNLDASFGFSYQNSLFKLGSKKTITVEKVLNKSGTWKIWPSYHLSLATGEKYGPDEWHTCILNVSQKIQDSDKDGVADDKDNCPNIPNPDQSDIDKDNIGDVCDSCDDRDFDKDGIRNCQDKCPEKPETFNNYQDDDGCPDEKPKEEKIPLPKEEISPLPKQKLPPPKEEKNYPIIKISAQPSSPTPNDQITFVAKASDPSGIEKILIFVNDEIKKICAKKCTSLEKSLGRCSSLIENSCTFVLSPQPIGKVTYFAKAINSEKRESKTSKKELQVALSMEAKLPTGSVGVTLISISGTIYSAEKNMVKVKVCQAERTCHLRLFFGREFFCSQYCLSEGFYVKATKIGEGIFSYHVNVPPGQYILKPIYQPVGVSNFKTFDPEEQFVIVGDENIEGIDFTYLPIRNRNPKIDVIIAAFYNQRGSSVHLYSDEERDEIEEKISQYQLALADEGLSSYFLYLGKGSSWYTPSNIRGQLQELNERFSPSYLILIGREQELQLPLGTPTYDIYGDMDGDGNYLLDIPIGIIPQPRNVDIDLILNYFDTITQIHRNGGIDLSSYYGLYMDGDWPLSLCAHRELFGKECNADPNCKNQNLDCTFQEANGKGFFLFLLHGSSDSPQKFSTNIPAEGGSGKCLGWDEGRGFSPSDLSLLNVRNSLWMAWPCFSAKTENKEYTYQSIPMTFLKNGGGAIYIGNLDAGTGSQGCPHPTLNCRQCLTPPPGCEGCTGEIPGGDAFSGTLFVEIAKRFTPGKRIGDAFLEGKNYYYNHYNFSPLVQDQKNFVYHVTVLYGDPTIKIKNKW